MKDVIIAIILVIFGAWIFLLAISFVDTVLFAGAKYDVTIIVQAVEKSSRFGEHTNVWAQVYGEQDITYKFFGYHDFEVGKTYRIIFIDKPWFRYFWFEVAGEIIEKQLVGD